MDSLSLKLLCFQSVFQGLECEISDCTLAPVAFVTLKDENCLLCRNHFEYFIYFHDGYDRYPICAGGRGMISYTVWLGTHTAFIYNKCLNPDLVKRYIFIEHIFLGKPRGLPVNTILLKLNLHKYVYVGPHICEFEIEDEIVEFYSYEDEEQLPHPVAVGNENVYFLDGYSYYPRSSFPERTSMSTYWPIAYKEFLSEEPKEISRKNVIHSYVY